MTSPLTIPNFYRTHKPPVGTPMKTGHPLAHGLSRYVLFNEGAGSPTIYMPSGKSISTLINNPAGSGWISSPYGPAFKFGPTTFFEVTNVSDLGWCPKLFSMFAIIYPVANGTTDRAIFGTGYNNSAGEVQLKSTGIINIDEPFSSTFLTSTGTLPNNKWSSLGCTWDIVHGNYTIAINGQKDNQILGSTKPSFTSGGCPSYGCWAGFGTASYWGGGGAGAMAVIYMWYGRVLTYKDFYELHKAPFCMF